MGIRIEKRIRTTVKLYMDNGESSVIMFDTTNDDENEDTFADAEICRQRLVLAVDLVESLDSLIGLKRKSDAILTAFEVLADAEVH